MQDSWVVGPQGLVVMSHRWVDSKHGLEGKAGGVSAGRQDSEDDPVGGIESFLGDGGYDRIWEQSLSRYLHALLFCAPPSKLMCCTLKLIGHSAAHQCVDCALT